MWNNVVLSCAQLIVLILLLPAGHVAQLHEWSRLCEFPGDFLHEKVYSDHSSVYLLKRMLFRAALFKYLVISCGHFISNDLKLPTNTQAKKKSPLK